MLSTVDDTGVTATFSGFFRIVSASREISGGIVAEKNRVCRPAGSFAMIFFTS